jgi:hypothetical protein
MLFGIEGSRVVLEVLDQGSRLGSLIKDFRLAFINAATAAHWSVPWLGEVHGLPWLQVQVSRAAAAAMGERLKRSPSA